MFRRRIIFDNRALQYEGKARASPQCLLPSSISIAALSHSYIVGIAQHCQTENTHDRVVPEYYRSKRHYNDH